MNLYLVRWTRIWAPYARECVSVVREASAETATAAVQASERGIQVHSTEPFALTREAGILATMAR